MTTTHHTPAFPLMGAWATVLATADDTHDAWEAFELSLGPGARSPLHTLAGDKLFCVVSGTVTVVVGDETREVTSGPVFVPAGTPHCYRNDSGADARVVVVTTGPGQIDFLRGMSRLTAGGPPDPSAVAAHAAAHGVVILAPPA